MDVLTSTKDASGFADSKSHYLILDGLRGVAAIMVVIFHLFETFSENDHLKQIVSHGYLGVDFFFLLSGFVVGYAYDDRWDKMTLASFFRRRVIRLHPMIVMGMVVGAIGFYFTDSSELFPLASQVPMWKILLTMLVGFTLLPLPTSMDIRGWDEMHPLNGPAWSLFFEYVANILYALFIRKFSNKLLSILVFVSGCALIHLAVTSHNGDLAGGWSIEPAQFRIGLTRLLYPFFAGLLLSRLCKPSRIKHAFLYSSLVLVFIFSSPRVGGSDYLWLNGLYESLCVIFIFPLVVYIGISGELKGTISRRVCKFFGDISYPLYITHYSLIYLYTAWAIDHKIPIERGWQLGVFVLFASIALAYGCLIFYDIPVRKWLSKRLMDKN